MSDDEEILESLTNLLAECEKEQAYYIRTTGEKRGFVMLGFVIDAVRDIIKQVKKRFSL